MRQVWEGSEPVLFQVSHVRNITQIDSWQRNLHSPSASIPRQKRIHNAPSSKYFRAINNLSLHFNRFGSWTALPQPSSTLSITNPTGCSDTHLAWLRSRRQNNSTIRFARVPMYIGRMKWCPRTGGGMRRANPRASARTVLVTDLSQGCRQHVGAGRFAYICLHIGHVLFLDTYYQLAGINVA